MKYLPLFPIFISGTYSSDEELKLRILPLKKIDMYILIENGATVIIEKGATKEIAKNDYFS